MKNFIRLTDCAFDKTIVRAITRETSWSDKKGTESTYITLWSNNSGPVRVRTKHTVDEVLAAIEHKSEKETE